MNLEPVGVGIIGAGVISKYYLDNLVKFPDLRVVAIADLDVSKSKERAEQFGIRSTSITELLADEDIEIVLNLTVPSAHYDVSNQILRSGKNVWSEKPIALARHDALTLLTYAEQRGLRVACAPDTILGASLQTAQRTIRAGRVGDVKSAVAIMQSPGPEGGHPNPDFYFWPGGGPLLDMGPYYLSALVINLGPVSRVQAISSTARAARQVQIGPRAGESIDVMVPTQHMALLEFGDGARATLITSFDSGVWRDLLEIHGTDATLEVPNPNRFDGTGRVVPLHAEPEAVPAIGSTFGRGVGVLDLARSLRSGTTERASGQLALHVLDILLAIQRSAETGLPTEVSSTVVVPEPLDPAWDPTEKTLTTIAKGGDNA
ncbi:Gfo/Idh/MocA family protein [Leifsonia sp. 2MCAF36]|uniref:Gfo/Idh/MocA family protein n=1 Tax=Leifsonia sp. 2MCAF36 TaxID=3232988 RepID=UPI003F9640E7